MKPHEMIEAVVDGDSARKVLESVSFTEGKGLENLDGWDETDSSIDGLLDGLQALAKSVKAKKGNPSKIQDAIKLVKQVRKLVGGTTLPVMQG